MAQSRLWRNVVLQVALAGSFFSASAGAQAVQQKMPAGKYVGPGSCGATACHGSVQPRTLTRVLQNEYSTWVTKDSHFLPFSVAPYYHAKKSSFPAQIFKPDNS